MANKKITELTAVTTLPDAALLTAVDTTRGEGDQNVKITKANLQADLGSTQDLEDVIAQDPLATSVPTFEGGVNVGNGTDASISLLDGNPDTFIYSNAAVLALIHNTQVLLNAPNTELTGDLTIGAYTLPNTDGTSGQVLKTDGSGTLTWVDSSGGAGDLLAANNLSDLDNADTAISNLGITATATELNYSDGVTSNIQDQIDNIVGGSLPWIDITQAPYNAVADNLGDAGVDSTTAWIDALDDLVTQGGGVLYVPNTGDGRFNIAPLGTTSRDLSGVTILGGGKIFVKESLGAGASGQGRGVLVNLATGTDNFSIENLDILVSNGAFRAGFDTGVIMSTEGGIGKVNIDRVIIKNESKLDTVIGVDGITFYRDVTDGADTATIESLTIRDCDIDLYGKSIYGIQLLRQCKYVNIENNKIFLRAYTDSSNIAFNAIAVYGDTENFNVSKNTILGSGHSAIAISMASYGNVDGNYVYNVPIGAEAGIEVEYKDSHGDVTYQPQDVNIINNYVFDCYYGIWVTERDEDATTLAPKNILIQNNHVFNSTLVDVLVASDLATSEYTSRIKNVTIDNNYLISTATDANIRVYDADGCTITNNICDGAAKNLIIGRDATVFPIGYFDISHNKFLNATLTCAIQWESSGSDAFYNVANNEVVCTGIRGFQLLGTIASGNIFKVSGNVVKGATDCYRFNNEASDIANSSFINNYAIGATVRGFNLSIDTGTVKDNYAINCTNSNTITGTGIVTDNNQFTA